MNVCMSNECINKNVCAATQDTTGTHKICATTIIILLPLIAINTNRT